MNTLKIILLMTFLTVLLVLVGQTTFGSQGAFLALGLAAVLNLGTYFFSDRMVLAMYGAREVTEAEAPVLYDVARSLAALAAIILAPLAAMIVQAMISRQKEFRADESGAHLSGKPLALASALKKLEAASQRIELEGAPGTAHLFIVNPFAGGLMRLFSTHPPTEERVARLTEMAYGSVRPQ